MPAYNPLRELNSPRPAEGSDYFSLAPPKTSKAPLVTHTNDPSSLFDVPPSQRNGKQLVLDTCHSNSSVTSSHSDFHSAQPGPCKSATPASDADGEDSPFPGHKAKQLGLSPAEDVLPLGVLPFKPQPLIRSSTSLSQSSATSGASASSGSSVVTIPRFPHSAIESSFDFEQGAVKTPQNIGHKTTMSLQLPDSKLLPSKLKNLLTKRGLPKVLLPPLTTANSPVKAFVSTMPSATKMLGGIPQGHLLNFQALPSPIGGPSLPRLKPKDLTCPIPACVSFLPGAVLHDYIRNIVKNEHLVPMNLLIIDTRPFTDYVNDHVVDSLNISLPSTLLRRPNFNLARIINSLSDYEQSVFQNYGAMNKPSTMAGPFFNNGVPSGEFGLPAVLLYDNSSSDDTASSVAISYMASKFSLNELWNAPVFILQGGIHRFKEDFPEMVESGTNESLNVPPTPKGNGSLSRSNSHKSPRPVVSSPVTESSTFQHSPGTALSFHLPATLDTARAKTEPRTKAESIRSHTTVSMDFKRPKPPALARFVLPAAAKPVFKTRHHEEVSSVVQDPTLTLNISLEDCSSGEVSAFPEWLTSFISEEDMVEYMALKFQFLENKEKERMNFIFSHCPDSRARAREACTRMLADELDNMGMPNAGLELGAKNRYKDIFPYEHSRVKLGNSLNGSDYINANYLSSTGADCPKYIACQGPLNDTIGDFWRLVVEQGCPIIFSLTDKVEGGSVKCAAFWESGEYHTNGLAKVTELETVNGLKLSHCESRMGVVLRRLLITIDDALGETVNHEVLQIQVLSWPDMGTSVESVDLISLVSIKRHILAQLNDGQTKGMNDHSGPVIVHCSAGCGRTGTFCAIDSVVDSVLNNNFYPEKKLGFDPVFDAVDGFRKYRLSMVQTLRQYMLAYDTIFMFIRLQLGKQNEEFLRRDHENLQMGILKRFIDDFKNL
ncbi:hypothetical protein BABINDRAFT_165142 [Babjeviella inositovora NRRL Y-12698]|uniref:protein-tyrosine-phosphatase n=1 Tax=Babjeviella inositovora NRRL Y-12698 TaxID=984486 RepID=A0A1E3QVC2_9ASCO|nr:uncharacterized protein BABINDRAFT_165142 [Babjeviella inositovora NRRL Y-12698]ODQ81603.1 hypothetical protein BABINDRAFT_165142 [Babjeviella inositovora NRRL Y-12698]